MAVNLTSLAPPRDRAGAALVLAGSGFAAAGNTVTIDGISAAIVTESATSITVTVPGGIRTDRFIPVEVTHATDASAITRQWWSKATKAVLQTFLMDLQKPGEFEDFGSASSLEHPGDIEAKDIEALHEFLQFLPLDVLQAAGDMLGRNANGVGRVTNGAIGSAVMLDRSIVGGASGINYRTRQPCLLTWGSNTEDSGPKLMTANSRSNTSGADPNGTEQHTPNGGKVVVFFVYVDKQSGTAKLDRVELLRNGLVVIDSTGLAIAAQGIHVLNVFDALGDVAASDRFSVRITQDAGTGVIDCLAALSIF